MELLAEPRPSGAMSSLKVRDEVEWIESLQSQSREEVLLL